MNHRFRYFWWQFFHYIGESFKELYLIQTRPVQKITTYWIIFDKDHWYARCSAIYWDKEWHDNMYEEKLILEKLCQK